MSGMPANSSPFLCCPCTNAVTHPSAANRVPRCRSIPTIPAPGAGRAARWSAESISRPPQPPTRYHPERSPPERTESKDPRLLLRRGPLMPYLIGLIIALFITLTGVGAGTITVPILVLFLGVPAPVAVTIGLMFAAVVKLILVPAQIVRGNVAWRTLGYMLLGGIPGVLLGSLFLKHLITAGSENVINAILGAILVTTATWQILFSFRPIHERSEKKGR